MRTDLHKSPAELVAEIESLRAQIHELRGRNGKDRAGHPLPEHPAFADQKERLQAALTASGTGTFRWDIRTDALDWDENIDRLFGLAPGATARSLDQFITLVHPDDRFRVIDACRRCRAEGADFDEAFRVVWPDGSVHWLDDKGKTFFDREGRPAYMTGACVDITARVLDEERLRRLAKIAEHSPDFIGMADGEMRPIWVNPAGMHLVGLDSAEAVQETRVIDYFAESERGRVEGEVVPALLRDGQWDGEVQFRHFKTGETFPVSWNAFVVRNETTGQVTNVCCVSKDLRERKRVESELLAREERYRALFESFPQIAWVLNPAGQVVHYNRWWNQFTGLPSDPSGLSWLEAIHPDDRAGIRSVREQAISRGEAYETQVRVRRKDGEFRWHLARVVPMRDPSGNVLGWLGNASDIDDIRRAENALRESEERFRNMADHSPSIIWVTDPGGHCQYLNRQWQEYTGQRIEDACGYGWIDMVHPEEQAYVGKNFRECNAARKPFRVEYRLRRRDGVYRWAIDAASPRFGADGTYLGYVGSVIDIHDRREAEEAVRGVARELRQLADVMPQIVWMARPDGYTDYYNRRWYDFTGVHEGDPDSWLKVLHPDDVERSRQRWEHSVRTGEPYENEYRFRRASDGEYRWHLARGNPIRDEESRIVRWYGTSTDIHDRKTAADALREKQELLSLTQQATGTGAFEWDVRTGRVSWSPEQESLYGLAPGSHDGTHAAWKALVLPEDREAAEAAVRASMETGIQKMDFRILRPDGQVRWMHSRARVFYGPAGDPLRVVGINYDITDRKLVEEQLRAAREEAEQASKAKDDFLAALSHELRTPLAPVLLTATALERDEKLPPELLPAIQMIVRNVGLECRLIKDLLDITRIVRGKLHYSPQTIDLHALVENVLKICSHEIADKCIGLSLRLVATPHHVVGDPARLQQILWNLVKNAAKFTPAGGTISISTRLVDAATIAVEVADSGIGIDRDLLPRLFNAFEQGRGTARQFGGLGLGLAISHHLAAMHGGTLVASSEGPGRGSTFMLTLPVHVAAAEPSVRSTTAPAALMGPAGQRLRVLLVEDHLDTLKVMERLLGSFDCDVAPASSVKQALTVSATASFDLLLSDLDLPDGTGLDVVCSLKKRQDLYAVALSGYGAEQDIRRSLDAGFDAHLAKPIDLHSLEALVSAVRSRVSGAGDGR